MTVRYWLVMPAAGRGKRLGADRPKQYLSLLGRTMIEWSLDPFLEDPLCLGAVVATAADDADWPLVRARLARAVIDAPGGEERSDSVRQALEVLRTVGAKDEDWVLVHDAARPCVSTGEIRALLQAVGAAAAAKSTSSSRITGGLLALPLADTLKRAEATRDHAVPVVPRAQETVPREALWRALTPQMFRLGELLVALRACASSARVPTDEAQAMEWQGATPQLVSGESTNLKVTTLADLALAESILQRREVSR